MSECACLYDSGDGDEAEFYSARNVRARKAHKCCECLSVIPADAVYYRVAGKWDGIVSSYVSCLLCREIQLALYCDGEFTFSLLWDDIEEQMFVERKMNAACLDKLTTVEAKQLLEQRWWEWVGRHGDEAQDAGSRTE